MHQLRYPDEVKPWSEVPAPPHGKPAAAELALARKVIDHLRRASFDPSRYKDEVKARVRALIARKARGGEITAPPAVERAPVTDLMAALKASLGADAAGARSGTAPGRASDDHGTRTTARRPAHTARSRRSSSGAGGSRTARARRAKAHR
jgi:non-homologous end joining protein Ku